LSLDAEDIAVEVQPELKTFTRVGDVFADVRYHKLVLNNRDAGQPMLDLIEHHVFDWTGPCEPARLLASMPAASPE
jgi:hypothetical protein